MLINKTNIVDAKLPRPTDYLVSIHLSLCMCVVCPYVHMSSTPVSSRHLGELVNIHGVCIFSAGLFYFYNSIIGLN